MFKKIVAIVISFALLLGSGALNVCLAAEEDRIYAYGLDESAWDFHPNVPGVEKDYSKYFQIGDANFDGIISIDDVTAIQKIVAGIDELAEKRLIIADVNGDKSLTIDDATMLQEILATSDDDDMIGIIIGPFDD